jgi:hypothetical protein
MEQYLEKVRWNLYCNKQEINIFIRFLIILGVLGMLLFFLFKQKWIIFTGAIIAVLIFLHIVHISVVKNKTQKKILQILEKDIQFWEKQKLEYIEIKKEIDNLENIEEKIYRIKDPDWFARRISWIEREIQKDQSWIEKFNNIS